jgi:hypothetical protein
LNIKAGRVVVGTHGILQEGEKWFVVYLMEEDRKQVLIHYMNTKDTDPYKAKYKYVYFDAKDNREVWLDERKKQKRYKDFTVAVPKSKIVMSGFSLTPQNKIPKAVAREMTEVETERDTKMDEIETEIKIDTPKKEPTEYPYILTIIDTFTKYAFVFPVITHTGVEVAIRLHELFSKKHSTEPSPYKPRLLLSDTGTELKNEYVNFVCKHQRVFQIYALPQRPLGIIERFNQTLKRKIKKAISEGRMDNITRLA